MIYSSGVKINPILGRGFRTLERVVGFLNLVRKTARKQFTSPKSLETWHNTCLDFKKQSRDQNYDFSIIFDDIIIQQQFFLPFKFFLCRK